MLSEKADFILMKLQEKIQDNNGLRIFFEGRNKFENWLQVELCGILAGLAVATLEAEKKIKVNGSKERAIDIVSDKLDKFAIQLKVLVAGENLLKADRLATQIRGLIGDIEILRTYNKQAGGEIAVIFVVFPAKNKEEVWKGPKYKGKIEDELGRKLKNFKEFNVGDTSIVLYFAQVNIGPT